MQPTKDTPYSQAMNRFMAERNNAANTSSSTQVTGKREKPESDQSQSEIPQSEENSPKKGRVKEGSTEDSFGLSYLLSISDLNRILPFTRSIAYDFIPFLNNYPNINDDVRNELCNFIFDTSYSPNQFLNDGKADFERDIEPLIEIADFFLKLSDHPTAKKSHATVFSETTGITKDNLKRFKRITSLAPQLPLTIKTKLFYSLCTNHNGAPGTDFSWFLDLDKTLSFHHYFPMLIDAFKQDTALLQAALKWIRLSPAHFSFEKVSLLARFIESLPPQTSLPNLLQRQILISLSSFPSSAPWVRELNRYVPPFEYLPLLDNFPNESFVSACKSENQRIGNSKFDIQSIFEENYLKNLLKFLPSGKAESLRGRIYASVCSASESLDWLEELQKEVPAYISIPAFFALRAQNERLFIAIARSHNIRDDISQEKLQFIKSILDSFKDKAPTTPPDPILDSIFLDALKAKPTFEWRKNPWFEKKETGKLFPNLIAIYLSIFESKELDLFNYVKHFQETILFHKIIEEFCAPIAIDSLPSERKLFIYFFQAITRNKINLPAQLKNAILNALKGESFDVLSDLRDKKWIAIRALLLSQKNICPSFVMKLKVFLDGEQPVPMSPIAYYGSPASTEGSIRVRTPIASPVQRDMPAFSRRSQEFLSRPSPNRKTPPLNYSPRMHQSPLHSSSPASSASSPEDKSQLPFTPSMTPPFDTYKDLEEKTIDARLWNNPILSGEKVNGRFADIVCPEETAVITHLKSGNSFYMHANYCSLSKEGKKIVAMQAPLVVGKSGQPDEAGKVWLMVAKHQIAEKTNCIFDLTSEEDFLKCWPDGQAYYPVQNGTLTFLYDDCTIRIQHLRTESRPSLGDYHFYLVTCPQEGINAIVKRFHFVKWPDNGAIYEELLAALVDEVNHPEHGQTFVHCRAGVGRTGTLIGAALIGEEFIKEDLKGVIRADYEEIALFATASLVELREQRAFALFVSNKDQWNSMLKYLLNVSRTLGEGIDYQKSREALPTFTLKPEERIFESISICFAQYPSLWLSQANLALLREDIAHAPAKLRWLNHLPTQPGPALLEVIEALKQIEAIIPDLRTDFLQTLHEARINLENRAKLFGLIPKEHYAVPEIAAPNEVFALQHGQGTWEELADYSLLDARKFGSTSSTSQSTLTPIFTFDSRSCKLNFTPQRQVCIARAPELRTKSDFWHAATRQRCDTDLLLVDFTPFFSSTFYPEGNQSEEVGEKNDKRHARISQLYSNTLDRTTTLHMHLVSHPNRKRAAQIPILRFNTPDIPLKQLVAHVEKFPPSSRIVLISDEQHFRLSVSLMAAILIKEKIALILAGNGSEHPKRFKLEAEEISSIVIEVLRAVRMNRHISSAITKQEFETLMHFANECNAALEEESFTLPATEPEKLFATIVGYLARDPRLWLPKDSLRSLKTSLTLDEANVSWIQSLEQTCPDDELRWAAISEIAHHTAQVAPTLSQALITILSKRKVSS